MKKNVTNTNLSNLADQVTRWLSGAAAGGVAGGLVGALINIGVNANHAKHFKTELQSGAILVILLPHSEKDRKDLESEWYDYDGIILRT
jgi:uncharacterized membrane protein